MIHVLTAEWKLLSHRQMALLYLVLSVATSLFVTFFMEQFIPQADLSLNGHLQRNLWLRNLFFLPLILMYCTAQIITEERSSGMLAETFLLPISRRKIVWGKLLSILSLVLFSLIGTFLPAIFLASAESIDISLTMWGYGINLLSDFALISLTMLLASFARSAGTAAIYISLFFSVEGLLRLLLSMSPIFFPANVEFQELSTSLVNYLPGTLFAAWQVWEESWNQWQVVGLFLMNAVFLALLDRRFQTLKL